MGGVKTTRHEQEQDDNLVEHKSSHDKRTEDRHEAQHGSWIETVDAGDVSSSKEGHEKEEDEEVRASDI